MLRKSALSAVIVVALAVLSRGLHVAAQEPNLHAEIVGVTDAEYPNARAIVNIEDSAGGAPAALTAADFSATIDGTAAPVTSANLASSANSPLDVLFVMDTSGSMAGNPIALAKDAAKAFVAQLDPQDRVAVMGFGDDVTLVQDYSVDRVAANSAIDSLVASGNTALYQATATAAFKAATASTGRRAVILLSDGADFGGKSKVSRDDALNAAGKIGAPFYAVSEGTDIDVDYLSALAQATKGRYLAAPTPEELNGLYNGIARLLRSQYVITFDASAARRDGTDTQLSIVVHTPSGIAEAKAAYKPSTTPPISVSIDGIASGEKITAPREITVTLQPAPATAHVVIRVDSVDAFDRTATTPYTFTYDPAKFGAGDHELGVHVDAAGQSVDRDLTFSSSAASGPGSSLPIVPIVAAGGAIALLVVVFALFKLRRRGVSASPAPAVASMRSQIARKFEPIPDAEEQAATDAREDVGEALGILISRAGADLGTEYPVGGRPVSIGSAARCGVRIEDDDLGAEEARIWVRAERLMLHRMTRLTSVAEDGTVGGWTILDPGDTFDIATHRFEFRLLPVPHPEAASSASPIALPNRAPSRAPLGGPAASPAQASTSRLAHLMPTDALNSDADLEQEAS